MLREIVDEKYTLAVRQLKWYASWVQTVNENHDVENNTAASTSNRR